MLKGVPQTHSPGGYYFMRIFLIHVVFFLIIFVLGTYLALKLFQFNMYCLRTHCHPTTRSSEWGVLCVHCKQASAQTAVKQGWEVSGVRGTSPP